MDIRDGNYIEKVFEVYHDKKDSKDMIGLYRWTIMARKEIVGTVSNKAKLRLVAKLEDLMRKTACRIRLPDAYYKGEIELCEASRIMKIQKYSDVNLSSLIQTENNE